MSLREEGNINKQLFDLILKSNSNPEKNGTRQKKKLKEGFKEITNEEKTFYDKKKYLYNLLFKALRNYNYNNDIDFELRDMLHNINILYDKGLYEQCLKMIDKAEETATLYELYPILLEIIRYRHGVVIEMNDLGMLDLLIKTDYEKRKEAIRKLEVENEYIVLTLKIYKKLKQLDKARNEKDWHELEELISSPYFQNESMAISRVSKNYFYDIRYFYAHYTYNYEEAYIYLKKIENYLESNPHIMNFRPGGIIYTLSNLGMACLELQKYEEIFALSVRLKEVLNKYKLDENFVKRRLYNFYGIEIRAYSAIKNFEEAERIAEKIINEFNDNKKAFEIYNELYIELLFIVMILYLETGKLKEALKINNILLNLKTNLRQDLLNQNQLISLIIYFELKEYDYLPYRIISTYRYLLRNMSLNKSEAVIIKFIKDFSKIRTEKGFIEAAIILNNELRELKNEPSERKFFTYYDFTRWIESKFKTPNTD
jgi:hypothetical protein